MTEKINTVRISESVAKKLKLFSCVFQTKQLLRITLGKYIITLEEKIK